jgi:hypothetical protein
MTASTQALRAQIEKLQRADYPMSAAVRRGYQLALSDVLATLDRSGGETPRKEPDSADWWREVAQGLGVRCFDMQRALDAAWQDIHDWLRYARDVRMKVENPNYSPLTATEAGIAKSEAVLRQIGSASTPRHGETPRED